MAQRRMMSMQIIDTDAFMDMPHSSQCLYMHMLMRADDDGFVANAKKIMRMIGAQDDDLKILFGKKFVIPFESGVCVIKHWRIHNYIQKDRYHETTYIEEKAKLKVKQNGGYKLDTECVQNGDPGKVRLELGKVRLEEERGPLGEFGNVKLTAEEHARLVEQLNQQAVDQLIVELDQYIASTGKQYKSHYATIQAWARRRIQEHVALVAKSKTKIL